MMRRWKICYLYFRSPAPISSGFTEGWSQEMAWNQANIPTNQGNVCFNLSSQVLSLSDVSAARWQCSSVHRPPWGWRKHTSNFHGCISFAVGRNNLNFSRLPSKTPFHFKSAVWMFLQRLPKLRSAKVAVWSGKAAVWSEKVTVSEPWLSIENISMQQVLQDKIVGVCLKKQFLLKWQKHRHSRYSPFWQT